MGVIAVIVVEGEKVFFQIKGDGVRLPRFVVSGKGWPWEEKKDKDEQQDDRRERLGFILRQLFK